MAVLSDRDLAFMRGSQGDLLPSEVEISDLAEVSDGAGGFTKTWTKRLDVQGRDKRYPARIGKPAGEEARIVAERLGPRQGGVLTLPEGIVIDVGDRIEFVEDGVIMQVEAILNQPQSWSTAIRCVVGEVD